MLGTDDRQGPKRRSLTNNLYAVAPTSVWPSTAHHRPQVL